MTTSAHCTRTWRTVGYCSGNDGGAHHCSALDSYYHVQHICVCGNVEPPADVAPDPRLDAIDPVIRSLWQAGTVEHALTWGPRILDALDAMRPDEMSIYDFVAGEGWTEEQRFTPAPAWLSAAQEIRLEVFRSLVGSRLVGGWTSEELLKATHRFAAEVEHGPDETADLTSLAQYTEQVMRLSNFIIDEVPGEPSRSEGAVDTAIRIIRDLLARADLAEARLGLVTDAVKDLETSTDPLGDWPAFADTVREYLAWTPDDTATPDVCPSTGEVSGHDKAGCACWDDDTAPADAATGDGDG